jgi:hypothetical protein
MIMPRKDKEPKGALGKVIPISEAVELIDIVLPEVQNMIENEGLYIATNPADPAKGHSVFASINGRLFAMQIDFELDPTRFVAGTQFDGPFKANTVMNGGVE